MHVLLDLIPGNDVAGAVGAEDGVRGVEGIPQGIVAASGDDRLLIRAGLPGVKGGYQPAPAPGEDPQLPAPGGAGGGRRQGGQTPHSVFGLLRGFEGTAHPGQVGQNPPQVFLRHRDVQGEGWLQEPAGALFQGSHQPLAEGPVGGLAEIPALRMLEMRPAGRQGDFHIGDRRTGQHPGMHLFLQVGHDQPLPVQRQLIDRDGGGELQAASRRQRLQQQMNLGVVAERLIMPDALHGLQNRFPIQDAALGEGDLQPVTIVQLAGEHLQIDIAHGLNPDLPAVFEIIHLDQRLFLLQGLQAVQHIVQIRSRGRNQPTLPAGTKGLRRTPLGSPKPVPRPGFAQPDDAAQASGRNLRNRGIARPGIQPQLGGLLRPAFFRRCRHRGGRKRAQGVPNLQHAARDLQEGQPRPLRIPGDLVDAGTEGAAGGSGGLAAGEKIHQRLHALVFQGAAEEAGEQLPLPEQGVDPLFRQGALPQKSVQARLVAQGDGFGIRIREGQHHGIQLLPEGGEKRFSVPLKVIHFIDEENHRKLRFRHQLPQGPGMALDALRRADHQHGRVHDSQRPFRLSRKIRMPGGVDQGQLRFLPGQPGFLGKDGDAALLFHAVRIQKHISVIHPALPAQRSGEKKHGFGQRGFPGVHVGRQADHRSLSHRFSLLSLSR